MIRLFKKDETNFDSNGLGVLDPAIKENVVEEKMNGIYNFDFAYLSSGKHAGQLEGDMVIKAPTPDGDQLFRVYKVTKNISYLEVNCYHIFYDLAGNFIEDTNIVSQSGQAAITHFGTGLQYATRFKFISNIVRTNSARMVRLNAVQALLDSSQDNSFLSRWGGEIKRDNFTVFMNDIRGNDKGFKIRHGKNLTGYEANIDHSSVVTRIMPYGYNGLMLPEKYVDSPLRDKYAFTRIKKIEYTNIKAIDPDATSNDEDAVPLEEAYELLRQAAVLEYSVNKVDIPTSNFKVTFKNLADTKEYADFKALEKVDPWDYVTVIADNLDIKSRMISYKYDAITKSYKEVELGNYVPSFSDTNTETNNKISNINNDLNNITNDLNTVAESANGKNSSYYGSSEPSHPADGDLWYRKNGDKTQILQYDGKSVPPGWKLVVDDATGEEVKQSVDEALKGTQEAINNANDAVAKANQAVADAGFANDTATQAKSDAAAATQSATTALTNAGTALSNAKNALDNVTKLDQTVKTEVTNINGQLAQKVSQTTFDTLKGTVTSQGTLINQNKAEIQLKADLSLVNTIKQTVTNNTAAIDLNSKEIKLKASQSDVDKLGGRVTNAEAQIKLQADQIKLTVSKTELTNILGDYATQTWTQSQIKSTTDQINLSVTQIKTEVENNDTENLIPNSSFKLGKAGWSGWETPYIHDPVVENYHSKQYTAVYFGQNKQPYADLIHDGKIPMKPNTPYVFQIKTRSLIKNHSVTYIQEYDAAGKVINDHAFILNVNSPDYITNIQKFTTSASAEYGVLRIRAQPGDQFMASELMLTEGSIVPKNWYPSSVDNATTADFANLEITIKGIQTTVANKADKSQVTQMAGQITSLVASTNNPNLIPNSGLPKDTLFWRVNDTTRFKVTTHAFYTKGSLFALLAPQGTAERTAGTAIVSVTRGAAYTVSLGVFGGSNVVGCDVFWLGRKHGETTDTKVLLLAANFKPNPSKMEFKSWTFNVGDCDEGYIRVDNNGSTSGESTLYFGEVKLEKGGRYTPWEQTAESSEIVQTREMINLRVQKGDVINQINISPEEILIAGQKIHITGQTSIDNAVIKDAMIANIKADKITAGTLNAANVNVINLNANNITTGTIRGANLSMNLNTGQVVFQKGYITSADGRIRFDLDSNYFRSLDYNNNGFEAKDGQFVWYSNWSGSAKNEIGRVMFDVLSEGNGGIAIQGKTGASLITNQAGVYVGTGGLNDKPDGVGISGNAFFWGNLDVMGKKNAVHVTSKGVVETPAYETAESYLGDIGESITDECGSALIRIDDLFNQIINTHHDYQVFISSYSNATIWVEERNATSFEVHSNIPNAKFAWEIKAKRRGYETDRLVKSEMKYEQLNKFHEKKVSA